ncbi:hypothetical protein GCM10017744_005240 [Streptomyces antimycoticus]|uniref:Uncharacterized protein n=1 Tax=Streptomyces antimycoticus TaxID=68175 RepID=A0A4D4KRU8_9ACTN|nr:hypothetical protein SANT12839_094550 [Streptomyces antimycoticus]
MRNVDHVAGDHLDPPGSVVPQGGQEAAGEIHRAYQMRFEDVPTWLAGQVLEEPRRGLARVVQHRAQICAGDLENPLDRLPV